MMKPSSQPGVLAKPPADLIVEAIDVSSTEAYQYACLTCGFAYFHGSYAPAQARHRASKVAHRWPQRPRRLPNGVARHWRGDAGAGQAANRQGHRHADGGRPGIP